MHRSVQMKSSEHDTMYVMSAQRKMLLLQPKHLKTRTKKNWWTGPLSKLNMQSAGRKSVCFIFSRCMHLSRTPAGACCVTDTTIAPINHKAVHLNLSEHRRPRVSETSGALEKNNATRKKTVQRELPSEYDFNI